MASRAIPIRPPSDDTASSNASGLPPKSPAGPGARGSQSSPLRASARTAASRMGAPGAGAPTFAQASASSPSSPRKGALSARAATAAVFVPKSVAPSNGSAPAHDDGGGGPPHQSLQQQQQQPQIDGQGQAGYQNPSTTSLRGAVQNLKLSEGKAPQAFQPSYLQQPSGTDSGRGTPTSFGAYDSDGMSSMFDPTYMGPLPPGQHPQSQYTPSSQSSVAASASSLRGPGQPPPSTYNPYEYMNDYGDPGGMGGAGADLYAGTLVAKTRQPLQYHLSNPPLPHVSNLHPQHLASHAFFLEPNQREELQRKNEAIQASALPPELGGPKLPEELHVYHSLVPLEPSPQVHAPAGGLAPQLIDPRITSPTAPGTVSHLSGGSGEPSRVFGYRSHVYKALCTLDGKTYVLRRLEGFRLNHEAAIGLVEHWRKIRHPSIVSVREAFTTRAFGDQSIVFVYDYHPLATTLYAEHMIPKPPQPDRRTGRLQPVQMHVPEKTLWSYSCQLGSVLRCIHNAGMAARCVEPSKVLRTGRNRVRLNCCSIFDVIAYEPRPPPATTATHQAEDLLNLGKLLVSLACNSMSAIQKLPESLEHVARHYSSDFKELVLWLLSKGSAEHPKTADELGRMLGNRMADEADATHNYNDLLESSLMRELENARLVRLLIKLNLCLERPAFRHDSRWAETGERYPVSLFRDMVFHSQDEAGRPVVDLSFILTQLNRLDAGTEEKMQLVSRDEQSVLVASYREIKNCLESAFRELSTA